MRKIVDSIAAWPSKKKAPAPALNLSSKAAQADARVKGQVANAKRKKETANRLLRVDGEVVALYALAKSLDTPPAKVFRWYRDGERTMAALRARASK